MDSTKRLDILAVDPDTETRMRIKAVSTAVNSFGKLHQAPNLEDALRHLSGPDPVDILFVSEKLSDNLGNFIKSAKGIKGGQDAAYVMVVQASQRLQDKMATYMLSGVDGFLQEPFSAEALSNIIQLTVKVKKERADARENAAIRFLMQQISEKINNIAQLKGAEMDGRREMRNLVEMTQIFNTLDDEKKRKYLDAAVEIFEKAPIPPPLPKTPYKGVSSRVKQRLEQKVINKLSSPSV